MSLEDNYRRLSQAIVDAAKPADEEAELKAQQAAAVVVANNPLERALGELKGVKVKAHVPQGDKRVTAFDAASDLLGDAIQKARAAKQVVKAEKTETEEPTKSLGQLLAEAAAER